MIFEGWNSVPKVSTFRILPPPAPAVAFAFLHPHPFQPQRPAGLSSNLSHWLIIIT